MRKLRVEYPVFFALLIFVISLSTASADGLPDITNLGGDLSTSLEGRAAIQAPAPNVPPGVRKQKQLDGFAVFHGVVTKDAGLGQFFINDSCGGCHIQNGRGRVRLRRAGRRMNQMVIKVALPGLQENGAPQDIPGIGEQLTEKNVNRRARNRHRLRLRWRQIRGRFPDGTRYRLRKPVLRFRIRGYPRRARVSSLRMAPAIIGPGLLEVIPEADILANADPNDANQDGISGEAQYVPDRRNAGMALGRFGFRASHPTTEQQSAAASHFDMGVGNALFSRDGEETELNETNLDTLTIYQMLAGVPRARNQDDPEVMRGKELFFSDTVGCTDCHTHTFVTDTADHPELDNQTIHPFTDLLLHDMGPGLADGRAEFNASGSEWRTSALWGLGFAGTVSNVPQRYLHDGRARTLTQAILWHGGEAEASKNAFMNLHKNDRAALIAFLRSL